MYSRGKKKQHTIKNILICDESRRLLYLSTTFEGSVHDKAIADACAYLFPPMSTVYQDRGFQGYTNDNVMLYQPKKKPKNGTLTDEEKAENTRISRIRIIIEHVIRSVKRYRIVAEKIRIHCGDIRDRVMQVCCGLHNFLNTQRKLNRNNKA